MKNKLKKFAVLVLVITLFSSCSKEKSIENHLDGTWKIDNITILTQKTGDPDKTDVDDEVGSLFFKDDGRGFFYPYDTTGNVNPKNISWMTDDGNVFVSEFGYFEVVDDGRKTQEWKRISTQKYSTITLTTTTTIKLTKE